VCLLFCNLIRISALFFRDFSLVHLGLSVYTSLYLSAGDVGDSTLRTSDQPSSGLSYPDHTTATTYHATDDVTVQSRDADSDVTQLRDLTDDVMRARVIADEVRGCSTADVRGKMLDDWRQQMVDLGAMLSRFVTLEYFSDGAALNKALWFRSVLSTFVHTR